MAAVILKASAHTRPNAVVDAVRSVTDPNVIGNDTGKCKEQEVVDRVRVFKTVDGKDEHKTLAATTGQKSSLGKARPRHQRVYMTGMGVPS